MTESTVEQPSELESLKQIADNMGIPYRPNIGVDALRTKIENQKDSIASKAAKDSESPTVTKKRQELINEATKLVRCTVLCLDPRKKDHTGEIITVSNNLVGTLRKFVAFNVEYHLPQMMVNALREKKHRISYEVMDRTLGRKVRRNKFVNSYNIAELPKLTEEELKALAVDQRKREFNAEE